MDADKDALYWGIVNDFNDCQRRAYWYWHHRRNGTLRSQKQRQAQLLGRQAEIETARFLRQQGYQVNFTDHKAPFDLTVADGAGRAANVEVKISLFDQGQRRYQAYISQDELFWADVLVFIARNGRDWPYVIPIERIRPRNHIAIWSPCPADYRGQWSPYCQAWRYLEQAIARAQPRTWQLSLPMLPPLEDRGRTIGVTS